MSNKTRITFQCSVDVREALERYSADNEQTVSAGIVGILRDFLITQGYLEAIARKKQNSQPTTS
jgi:hypothetical protein